MERFQQDDSATRGDTNEADHELKVQGDKLEPDIERTREESERGQGGEDDESG